MTGRPRGFDRDAALAAAVEQFWRTGYEDTTIAMLTRVMGVTPPSLYAAFGDKERLFEEASSVYFRRTCEGVDAAAALPTAQAAVAHLLDGAARAHTGSATPPGCLVLTDPRLGAQRQVVFERVRDRMAQGVRDGDLAATADPDQLAAFLVAVMRGMSGCARDGGTAEEVLGIARAAMGALPVSSERRRRPGRSRSAPTRS